MSPVARRSFTSRKWIVRAARRKPSAEEEDPLEDDQDGDLEKRRRQGDDAPEDAEGAEGEAEAEDRKGEEEVDPLREDGHGRQDLRRERAPS